MSFLPSFFNLPQYLLFLLLMLPPQKFVSPPYFYARTKTVKNTNLEFTYNVITLRVMEICQLNRKLIQRFEIKISEKQIYIFLNIMRSTVKDCIYFT
jgi:hypothetical protein